MWRWVVPDVSKEHSAFVLKRQAVQRNVIPPKTWITNHADQMDFTNIYTVWKGRNGLGVAAEFLWHHLVNIANNCSRRWCNWGSVLPPAACHSLHSPVHVHRTNYFNQYRVQHRPLRKHNKIILEVYIVKPDCYTKTTLSLYSANLNLFYGILHERKLKCIRDNPKVGFLKRYSISIKLHVSKIFLSSHPTYVISFSLMESL